MLFHDPATVTSPRDFIDQVRVIFNGGPSSVSVAEITWEGTKCIGMRWNVARREFDDPDKIAMLKVCAGMPTSRGYPVWFILPEDIVDPNSDLFKSLRRGFENLNEEQST